MGEPAKKQNPEICPNCKACYVPQAKYCVCGHKWIHTVFTDLFDIVAVLSGKVRDRKT